MLEIRRFSRFVEVLFIVQKVILQPLICANKILFAQIRGLRKLL